MPLSRVHSESSQTSKVVNYLGSFIYDVHKDGGGGPEILGGSADGCG